MKSYVNFMVVSILIIFGTYLSAALYDPTDNPADYSMVKLIQKKSNLTLADIDQWKFFNLWFLKSQTAAFLAGGAMVHGLHSADIESVTASASSLGSSVVKGVGTSLSAISDTVSPYVFQPSERVSQWLSDPVLWTGALVVGVSLSVYYRLVYPRTVAGIIGKVKQYASMCESFRNEKALLPAEEKVHSTQYAVPMDEVTFIKNQLQQNFWVADANDIVYYRAVQNLSLQAVVASKLLEELEKSGNIVRTDLKKSVNDLNSLFSRIKIKMQPSFEKAINFRLAFMQSQADLANTQAGTQLKTAGTGLAQAATKKTYMDIVWGAVDRGVNAGKFLWENKVPIMAAGLTWGIVGISSKDRFLDLIKTYGTNVQNIGNSLPK